jgi:flagellar basal-body rod protein FlgB
MQQLAIFQLADAVARHAAGRHELVARNIANADTPGYKARDLPAFSAELAQRAALRTTRPTHLASTNEVTFRALEASAADADGPNGNSVALPDQLARGSQARGSYERALAVYGKTMGILKASLGRR